MNPINKLFFLVFLCIAFASNAQTVTVSGELRPRSEYAHGVSTLAFEDQDPAINTTQRTRLNLNYEDQWFASKFVLQDVRRWGSQSQLTTNEDFATSVHEAWAEAFFLENFSAKLGRQELAYDNHRILGNVGWAQQARSHDLALFTYHDQFTIHLGIAHHDDGDLTQDIYEGPDAYKNMQFAWFNKKWENSSLSFLFLNNGVPFNKEVLNEEVLDQVDKYSQTFGPYFNWTPEDWVIESNAYLQTGQNGLDQDLLAYEVLVQGTYLFDVNWSLGAGFEILSGTKYTEFEEDNTFTPLYGTNHKFNGFMDYFYVGNDGNDAGLIDLLLRVGYKKERLKYGLDIHGFWAHQELRESENRYLGIEADLSFGYNISKTFQLAAGYSHLFADEALELIKSGDKDATQNWGYVMLTFKPMFFNNKE